MKFRMIVKHKEGDADPWPEDQDRTEITTIEEARLWADEIIKDFNRTLRPYEKPRELIKVEHLDDESSNHDWFKTNLVTIMGKYFGSYDTMECSSCGITGKRHGVGQHGIQRDPEFKAYGYGDCKQAKVLLERRRKRREKAIEKAKKIDKD